MINILISLFFIITFYILNNYLKNIEKYNNINSNVTIILTSTVNINKKKSFLYQIDKNERIKTYLKSILQWLTKTNFNIILVENSGYNFDELNYEKNKYKNRFQVITFKENELNDAKYLFNNDSKGASEIFAINYAFKNSKFTDSIFIIKITARYFIPELEEYLSNYNLDKYDCLTQNNRNRCEMVGSHINNFKDIFNINLLNKNNLYDSHIENIWKYRTSKYKNILICKEFSIESTQRGGLFEKFTTI